MFTTSYYIIIIIIYPLGAKSAAELAPEPNGQNPRLKCCHYHQIYRFEPQVRVKQR